MKPNNPRQSEPFDANYEERRGCYAPTGKDRQQFSDVATPRQDDAGARTGGAEEEKLTQQDPLEA